MTVPNEKQFEHWNGLGGARWAAASDRTDRYLASLTKPLLAFAHPIAGEHVLDVGCGCGTTSQMLRERVGTAGAVLGLDFSGPMIEVARTRIRDVEFVLGDASTYELPRGLFELAFSRFGVMFFDDPVAAFANLRRGLTLDGRLAFMCWRDFVDNAWQHTPIMATRDLIPTWQPPEPRAPGAFGLADPEHVRTILASAGFHDIRIESHDGVMDLGATLEDAATGMMTIGPLATASAELDEPTRAQIRTRLLSALAQFETPQGITPPAAVWLVGARY